MRNAGSWIRTGLLAAGMMCGGLVIGQAQNERPSRFTSESIDIGLCVSDVEKSVKFYTEVLGFQEAPSFDAPGEFLEAIGLTKGLPIHVRVLTLGTGESATKLKLMQFKTAPGARVDQTYLHSTYGIRYLTCMVKSVNEAVKLAVEAGGKPMAKCPQPLPAGFPEGLGIANFRDPDGNVIELVGPYQP